MLRRGHRGKKLGAARLGGKLPMVQVGPGRTYTTLQAAITGIGTSPAELVLDDGTYTSSGNYNTSANHSCLVPSTWIGYVIRSASGNPKLCQIDYAYANSSSLPQNKGGILSQAPGTVKGIGFVRAGASSVIASGIAGVYCQNFSGSGGWLNVEDCTFNNCQNGIFVQPLSGTGSNIRLYARNCEFGYITTNGQCSDVGQAHDMYVSGIETFIENCRYPGPTFGGNTIKSRSPTLTVKDCWVAGGTNRAINYPEGGTLLVSGGTLYRPSTPNSANFISYGDENVNNYTNGVTPNPVFSGVNFVIGRANSTWLLTPAGVAVQFTGCTFGWLSGASQVISGSGTAPGLPLSPGTIVSAPTVPATSWP